MTTYAILDTIFIVMGRTIYIVGNWKMNNTIADATALAKELHACMPSPLPPHVVPVIAPPFTALWATAQEIGTSVLALAAQNVSYAERGAHTGEISPTMLSEMGVRYAIIGHSERRHVYHEDDAMVAARVARALSQNITPIICVGESLAERENGTYFAVCRQQVAAALAPLSSQDVARVCIAYEPVWAIGTGKTAQPQDAQDMHHYLRQSLAEIADSQVANAISILYGGSVTPSNSNALLVQEDIDGALVGGASLNAKSFAAIVESAL